MSFAFLWGGGQVRRVGAHLPRILVTEAALG